MTDYIIVGAGSGGAVLANRLSEDPRAIVTVIEAGDWDKSPFIHMPAGYFRLMQTLELDWGYYTAAQHNVLNRKMFIPRARTVGGCSTVNGLVYARGNRTDYDEWAKMGNEGWDFDSVLPYFKKAEGWQGGGDLSVHGMDGPLKTSRSAIASPLSKAWVEACKQAGFSYNDDLNSGDQEGVGPCDATVANGIRSSVSRAYITPVRDRKNLKVITKALVTRVILRTGKAVGVEYAAGREVKTLIADKEVILCGGAFNSPHLLQISGIGDPNHLRSVGIEPKHDLPGVGLNLQDHVGCGLKVRLTKPVSVVRQLRRHRQLLSVIQYFLTGTGPAAGHGHEVLAFLKTRPDLVAPDVQWHLTPCMYGEHGRKVIWEEGFMAYTNVSRPRSHGTVLAKSDDPRELPAIDPRYFSAPEDLAVMRDSIRVSREIVRQRAFDDIRGEEYAPGKDVVSNAAIEQYILQNCESVYHPVGTCQMGSGELAVVDSSLRVHGIEQLRVVDASVMPTLSSGNTNAPVIMIGEKAADIIIEQSK